MIEPLRTTNPELLRGARSFFLRGVGEFGGIRRSGRE